MDINELRQVVDRMTPNQLRNFVIDAEERHGVNQLLGKSTQEHLLVAALQLVREHMTAKGLKPLLRERRPSTSPHIITHKQNPGGVNGEVKAVKVSPEEMERMWNKEGNHYDNPAPDSGLTPEKIEKGNRIWRLKSRISAKMERR